MKKIIMMLVVSVLTTPALSQEAPICTDRPTKINNACTVPEGKVQIESDAIVWTRFNDPGTQVDVINYTVPTIKLGLNSNTDVQLAIAPYVTARRRVAGQVERIEGVGDAVLRVKRRLTSPSSSFQAGVIPFVKLPTAKRGIGNGEVEGGVALPISYSLPGGLSIASSPEVDILHDSDGRGKHIQVIGTAVLGKSFGKVGVAAELWTAQNYDPLGTVRQYSADAALIWLARPTLQFDVGANFGLNRSTPDVQLYAGISTRF